MLKDESETPTHYKIAKVKENGNLNKDYILIQFNKIILDKSMSIELTKLCGDKYNGTGLKKFKTIKYGNMEKVNTVKEYFENEKELDPIKVTPFNSTDKYEIIDGRHRYIMSLYKGYSHIPCNVYK